MGSSASSPAIWLTNAAPTAGDYLIQQAGSNQYYFNAATYTFDIIGATNVAELTSSLFAVGSNMTIGWADATNVQNIIDTQLIDFAAATIHLGAADAAAPVAQTLGVQNVVGGTSNTAGANFTDRHVAGHRYWYGRQYFVPDGACGLQRYDAKTRLLPR